MTSEVRIFNLLCWNVRGLGDRDKCNSIRDHVANCHTSIACFQETKLATTSFLKAKTFLPTFLSEFRYLDASGSRGVLTAWDPNAFCLVSSSTQQYSLTTTLASTMSDFTFSITNVYGPAVHADVQHFLDSLQAILERTLGAWVVAGDFNLIRGEADKNNSNINHALCSLFNSSIDALALTELPLLDRRFTWSNGRDDPTMERLDRIFFNSEMSILFPNSSITSQTRDVSDHTPLLVHLSLKIPKTSTFRFENAWLLHADFLPLVLPA